MAAHLHADSAATRTALEHHRIADGFSLRQCVVQIGQQARAGQQGHTGFGGQRPRRVLEAKDTHLLRRGADKGQSGRFTGLDKLGVFREETVTRMDGLRAAGKSSLDDALHRQVASGHGRRAHADRLIGHGHMRGVSIGFGIDRHGAHTHEAQRADDATGNHTPVGNKNFFKHDRLSASSRSSCQSRTGTGRPAP